MNDGRWDDGSRSTAAAVAMLLACGGLLGLGLLAIAPGSPSPAAAGSSPGATPVATVTVTTTAAPDASPTPAAATGTPATGAQVCHTADPVTGVRVSTRRGATTVTWDGAVDGEAHTYRVLWRTDPQGAWSELTTVTLEPTKRGVAVDTSPPTTGEPEYAVIDLLPCGATPVCGLGDDGPYCASALAAPKP